MRVKLTIAYNGAPYFGLQSQTRTDKTVLGSMQKAFARLGITEKLVASGRTDSGVHATAQVLHCDLPAHWTDLTKLEQSIHYQLPDTILLKKIEPVPDDFHARYSAKRRIYRYVLSDKAPNPFEADFVTFTSQIDLEKMDKAMHCFIGTHNFIYFKKSGSDTSNFVRTIYKAFAYRYQGKVILHFEANGYLRSQIRLMVGFLLAINEKILDNKRLIEQLDGLTQHYNQTAPENGLYLAKVKY